MPPPQPKPAKPAASAPSPKPAGAAPPSEPRPGAEPSPKEASNKRLEQFAAKKAGVAPEPAPAAPEPTTEAPEPQVDPDAAPSTETPPAPAAATPGKPAKANPWKLRDEERELRVKAETELQQLRANILPDQDKTALTERVTKAEARAQELENHIRFVDYQQSTEFKEKYDAPYQAAFQRAVTELSEIPVTQADGQVRGANAQDLWAIVSLPPVQARQLAEETFGPQFANDIMAYRREIKTLFDARSQALENEKKNGAERVKKMTEQQQRVMGDISKFNQTAWTQVEEALQKDPAIAPFITKRQPANEGEELSPEDKEWNTALEAGFKMIDENWPKNPNDPKLTPAERQEIIKARVAIKYRAAAYSAVRREAVRLRKELAEAHKELAQYRDSEPPAGGGGGPTSTPSGELKGRAGTNARLRAFAARRAAGN